ncbi:MAG: hypothetical protein ACYCW6_28030 [Candidatus Xenobia bacterium]
MSWNNNGIINTPNGQIQGAFAIRNNAHNLTQGVRQGVADGQLTPQEHAAIHQERLQNAQLMAADKAAGPVNAQERAQLRQNQAAIAQQISAFEGGGQCPPAG